MPASYPHPRALKWFVVAGTVAALPVMAAVTMPYSKPGLWIITQHMQNTAQPFESKLCIDKATQGDLINAGNATTTSLCSRNDISGGGNRLVMDAVCQIGPSKLTSHTVVTYAGDSAFESVTDGLFAPAFMGKTTTHGVIDAKWSGACPAGMKPGDMFEPHGMKLHMGPNGPVPMH